MANFTFTSIFDVGDKVFLKSNLDSFLDTTNNMEGFLNIDGNKQVLKIKEVVFISYFEIDNQGNQINKEKILYNLVQNSIPEDSYTSVEEDVFINGIEEDGLYSYDEGKDKINQKIADFQDYLNNL